MLPAAPATQPRPAGAAGPTKGIKRNRTMTDMPTASLPPLRQRVLDLVNSRPFTQTIIGLILVNAVILGIETFPDIMARHGPVLEAVDHVILAIFVVEL